MLEPFYPMPSAFWRMSPTTATQPETAVPPTSIFCDGFNAPSSR